MKANFRVVAPNVFLATTISACAHAQADKDTSNGGASPESIAAITKRASFDLECPQDQVNVTVIEKGNMMRPWTFGTSGCGKTKTYLSRAGTIIAQ